MWFDNRSKDSIAVAQLVIAGDGTVVGGTLIAAIDDIVRRQLWQNRSFPGGPPFASFGEFAIAPQPFGLGVSDTPGLRLVRFALLQNDHYPSLAELIDLCARQVGRPSENLADGEHLRFYTVPTSLNALDRILLTLRRGHQREFEELCSKNLTPRQAGIRAGFLVAKSTMLRFGVCDFEKIKSLPKKAQAELLCEVFKLSPVDAQCALLSRCIEPELGPDLARQWRERHKADKGK